MDRDLEILAKMREGTSQRIPVRIRAAEVTLRPLTIDETTGIAGRVMEAMKALPEGQRTALSENTLIARETLKLACTEEPGSKKVGELTDAILSRMTPDEIQLLFKQYVAVCDKVNPSLEAMPQEEVKALIEALEKKRPEELTLALIDCSFLDLVNVCRSLLLEPAPTDR